MAKASCRIRHGTRSPVRFGDGLVHQFCARHYGFSSGLTTRGKLSPDTPKCIIGSDATIVATLRLDIRLVDCKGNSFTFRGIKCDLVGLQRGGCASRHNRAAGGAVLNFSQGAFPAGTVLNLSMKQSDRDETDQRRAFAFWQRDQHIERVKTDDARPQFAMRVIWLLLGVACAVLGRVLLAILLR